METPLINGYRYDFGQIEIDIKGKKVIGIKEIKYANKRERSDVNGAHPQKLGRTKGRETPEASLTMFREEYYELLDVLGDGFQDAPFDITVTYGDDSERLKTDRVMGCLIDEDESGGSEGTDALEVPLTLNVMYIELDGKRGLKNPLGGGNQGVS